MTDKDQGVSFDPKTWIGSSKTPSDSPSETIETPASAPETAPEPTSAPLSALRTAVNRLDRRSLLGLGAGSGVLLVGAVTALLSRSAKTKAAVLAPVAESVASQDASAANGTTTRSMNLSGLGDIGPALAASGIDAESAKDATQKALKLLSAHGEVRLVMTLAVTPNKTTLMHATITYPDSSGVELVRTSEANYTATAIKASLDTRLVVKRGEIDRNSFYTSAVTAGITDSLIPDFAKVFAYDFDFQFEILPGDIFEAGFEQQVNTNEEVVGVPRLVYASLTTEKKSKSVYFFEPAAKSADEADGWYDGNGQSIIRSFMRTPIEGARVTSNFGIRVHPVLGFVKQHRGTDFGAPTGTPIYAAGDAKVVWAAMKGPNGNLVILEHSNGWQTYYLHMNAFGPGIEAGVAVKQGQHIGDVGTTGRSTGPHLHYEVHINGEAVDPQGIQTDEGKKLSVANLTAFFKERDRIDAARAQSTI